jgi:putative sterol carrier protein
MTTTERYMQAMQQSFRPEKAGGVKATFALQLTGEGGGVWGIAIADGQCRVSAGAPAGADTTISMSTDSYLKLAAGQLNVTSAYQKGEVKVSGNVPLALKITEMFSPWDALAKTPVAPAPETKPITPPTPPPSPVQPTPPPAPTGPTTVDYVKAMPNGLRPDKVGGLSATYLFQLAESGPWRVVIANRAAAIQPGSGSANVTIQLRDADFVKLAKGQLNTVAEYQRGTIKISGDVGLAQRLTDYFSPWADKLGQTPPVPVTPPVQPVVPPPAQPQPPVAPVSGSVYPQLMNGSFDDFQPFVYEGEAKVWKEPQFPERYGQHWTLQIISVKKSRPHLMDSEVFGKFTQKYFGGGGHDYHIHGHHSQVITSRYQFDLALCQTIAAQPGREYTFSGSLVTYYKGSNPPAVDNKIFKTIGIDPTGGRDWRAASVLWGERNGQDNVWRYPTLKVKAQAAAITVFIRLENTETDVGETELNIIHLDNFRLE